MGTAMVAPMNGEIMEKVLVKGDLSSLTPAERTNYYLKVCDSLGLNPMTQPFNYLTLNGKLQLYARKDAGDQLRKIHNISVKIVGRKMEDGIYTVSAQARTPEGREDEDDGAVNVANLKGDFLANAKMKAVTKAKRRVTLAICGLGVLDESEIETIPDARPAPAVQSKPSLPEVDEPCIGPEDGEALQALIRKHKPNLDHFRHDFNVTRLGSLPGSRYQEAVKWILENSTAPPDQEPTQELTPPAEKPKETPPLDQDKMALADMVDDIRSGIKQAANHSELQSGPGKLMVEHKEFLGLEYPTLFTEYQARYKDLGTEAGKKGKQKAGV